MSKLFDNFDKVGLKEWNEEIIKNLKDYNYKENLVSYTEGIEIHPVYSEENTGKIYPINMPSDWISFQEIDVTHTKTANQKAHVKAHKRIFERGLSAILLVNFKRFCLCCFF